MASPKSAGKSACATKTSAPGWHKLTLFVASGPKRDAQALTYRHHRVLKLRQAFYQREVFCNFAGVRDSVVVQHQCFRGQPGQQQFQLRGGADAVAIEKYEIEWTAQLADDLGGVSGA